MARPQTTGRWLGPKKDPENDAFEPKLSNNPLNGVKILVTRKINSSLVVLPIVSMPKSLRDMGLWASGLLDPHMGGEGVKPYQPSGLWKALAHPSSDTKEYTRDTGDKLYRRSLYVYWKRTSPHPMMNLFDAPSREVSCVQRSRSNTPLQSLALLNETQRIEMARSLAERLLTEAKDDQSRLQMIFQVISSRSPTTQERKVCLKLLKQMKEKFKGSPNDAKDLLSTGDKLRNPQIDLIEHAAWTQVSATLLASDLALLLY